MKLKVLDPTRIVLQTEARSVSAQGADGQFVLLPRHIDFTSALVPGILSYEDSEGTMHNLAVDEGILVKCGDVVHISTQNAVEGKDLGQLQQTIAERFEEMDEQQRKTAASLAKLEAGFVRQFLNLGK